MGKNKVNLYAKKYIDTVFAQRLLDSGFVSPDDQHLCWYRIKENGLVNSIIFFSRWRNIPVHLEVGFGIHTLFHRPVYTRTIDYTQRPQFVNELFYEKMLVEDCPVNEMRYMPYSGDIPIIAPGREGRGFCFGNPYLSH